MAKKYTELFLNSPSHSKRQSYTIKATLNRLNKNPFITLIKEKHTLSQIFGSQDLAFHSLCTNFVAKKHGVLKRGNIYSWYYALRHS